MVDHLKLEESINYEGNVMVLKFKDGKFFNTESFETIRNRLDTEEKLMDSSDGN